MTSKYRILPSFLLCISIFSHVGNSEPREKSCSYEAEYNVSTPDGSEYRNNLETILTALYSNATTPGGFSSAAGTSNATTVYGLFLCRGDVSPGACRACVKNATTEVLELCPNVTRASVYYDDCTLRYSNQPIYSEYGGTSQFYTVPAPPPRPPPGTRSKGSKFSPGVVVAVALLMALFILFFILGFVIRMKRNTNW